MPCSGQDQRFFLSGGTLKLDISPTLLQALCSISKPSVNSNWSHNLETPHLGHNRQFFVSCRLEIWWLTLKKNKAPLLCCFKPCASFHSHWWIQTGVTVRKRSIRVYIGNILSCMTLKFDGWPWKTIGHLSHAASSFVHHFIAIGEFKLELQSGNTQFGSKLRTFFSHVTLKFDGWPRKTIENLFWPWPFLHVHHICQW